VRIIELLDRDDLQYSEAEKERAEEKLDLRVGNTGIKLGGPCIGSCPRKALLRKYGVTFKIDKSSEVMFEQGRAMEDVVKAKLERQLPAGYTVTGDDENSLETQLTENTVVSGRPDLFIKDTSGELLLAIELKTLCSVYTAISVIHEGAPKFANLAQAANYLLLSGLPSYKLVYIQSVDFEAPFFTKGRYGFPPPEKWRQENCKRPDLVDYRPEGRKGQEVLKPFKLRPTRVAYDLEFTEEGVLRYREEGSVGPWTDTIITEKSIADYFFAVEAQDEEKKLADRPEVRTPAGELGTFSFCDPKYCELSGVCDKLERNFEKWLTAAKEFANKED
jgi:hypothetical protein